jgi:hypothetical protein
VGLQYLPVSIARMCALKVEDEHHFLIQGEINSLHCLIENLMKLQR